MVFRQNTFFIFWDTFFDCNFFWVAATKWKLPNHKNGSVMVFEGCQEGSWGLLESQERHMSDVEKCFMRKSLRSGNGVGLHKGQGLHKGCSRSYQTLGPKFYWFNRTVITMSKNDPFWDFKTDSGSSRRALAFSGLKTRLGAKKGHFFENLYATLDLQVPIFS